MNSILALYVANLKEFIRDRLAMFFTLLLPVAFALFFGTIFGSSQSYKLNLGLAIEDAGQAGQQFATQMDSPAARGMLAVQRGGREELLAALVKGSLDVVMILPDGLSRSLGTGQPAPVEIYYDPARQASVGTGKGIVSTILAEANLAMNGGQRLLRAEERTVQAKTLRAVDFFVPNLLGMALLWLGLFATAQPLTELREQQVLRRLGATPLSRGNLLAGQVAWRVTLGLAQAAIFLLMGKFAMGVQMSGNWLLFIAIVVLGAGVFVSMGYLIAGIAKTVESAVAIAQMVNFPMMFLSGTFFEASVMPSFFRPIVQVMPLTYLNDALRQTMVNYAPLNPLWLDIAVLGAWLVALLVLGIRFFRWE